MTNGTDKNATTAAADAVTNSDAATQTRALGPRHAVRVLLIAHHAGAQNAAAREAVGLEATPRLRSLLEAADHTVSVAATSQWHEAVAATRPDIVLLEIGVSSSGNENVLEEAVEICQAIKRESPRLLILAVVPGGDQAPTAALWTALRVAGADDFVMWDVTRPALEARVLLLARFAEATREYEAARERLARYTQIDETTQLLNRRFFFQNAHRECSRARRYGHTLACLMVDIDYLDEMSKTFGYGCVEYVLRAVAYTVRQWTRDSDIAGRFSDRKFVVLLPETDIEGATAVREKILGALAESQLTWGDKELPLSVSIGESERRHESAASAPPILEDSENENEDALFDETGTEPLSVREELAAILEDADAALNVARRATIKPGIFVQYTPGE